MQLLCEALSCENLQWPHTFPAIPSALVAKFLKFSTNPFIGPAMKQKTVSQQLHKLIAIQAINAA